MYNQSDINIKNLGLAEIDPTNVYAMKKQRMIEGEDAFFLRQLIYCYSFLKYKEKLPLQPVDFYKVQKALTIISFPTKKSPLGLLLAHYIYDQTKFINASKFKQIMGDSIEISGNTLVSIDYMYKVNASDLIRYVKMYHDIF